MMPSVNQILELIILCPVLPASPLYQYKYDHSGNTQCSLDKLSFTSVR